MLFKSGSSPCSVPADFAVLHSLRAEPVNISFLLKPAVTAFAATSFDESKRCALRLDAFG
jgi:hypothetical protein